MTRNFGFTFHLILYAMQRCMIGSLPVMKRGVFNTTAKQNDRACSGKHRIHLGRKSPHVSVTGQDHAFVFLQSQGIVRYKFIAQGQMVNKQCYLEMLTRLQEYIRRKRPGIWTNKWILHHDNATVHDALRFRDFRAKNYITKMDHSSYSPELAPCDFWLFPKLKKMP